MFQGLCTRPPCCVKAVAAICTVAHTRVAFISSASQWVSKLGNGVLQAFSQHRMMGETEVLKLCLLNSTFSVEFIPSLNPSEPTC